MTRGEARNLNGCEKKAHEVWKRSAAVQFVTRPHSALPLDVFNSRGLLELRQQQQYSAARSEKKQGRVGEGISLDACGVMVVLFCVIA